MAVIDDASGSTLTGFVRDNIAVRTTVHTDAWRGYRSLNSVGYDHRPRSQRALPIAVRLAGRLRRAAAAER